MLELARGALAALEANRQRIDDLNVYPVPDGDTGTNLTADGPRDRRGSRALAVRRTRRPGKRDQRAALMGARGNSGVILSQIVRGAAESTDEASRDAGRGRPALRAASDAAYRAVKKPVEGTMLTVAARDGRGGARPGPGPRAGIVARGDATVAKTPEMLPVLKEAGVVDAGAAGLVEIVRGVAAALAGEPMPEPCPQQQLGRPASRRSTRSSRASATARVRRRGRRARRRRDRAGARAARRLAARRRRPLGAEGARAHRRPGRALSLGIARGAIGGVEIANMHPADPSATARLPARTESAAAACAVVAVPPGAGNRRLFESLGAPSSSKAGRR